MSNGCPVIFFSGVETVDATDLVVKGIFPIEARRLYDSQTDFDSPLGHGWAFDFDRRLFQYPDNSVVVRYGCGLKDKYVYAGGAYVTPAGVGRLGTLIQKVDSTFELTYLNGNRNYFDTQGRLTAIRDPQGNRQEFSYDSRGKLPLVGSSNQSLDPTKPLTIAYSYRLTRIDERAADGTLTGHYLLLAYDDPTGRLLSITTNDERSVTYEHDVQTGGLTRGNLTRVNGLEGIVSDYQYTDSRDPHNLTQDTPVLGKVAIVNTYDDQDRVTRQVMGTRQLDFTYTIPLTQTTLTTTITDASGANPYTTTESYEFDPSGKITKRTGSLGDEYRYVINSSKLFARREIWQKSGSNLNLLQAIDWTYDAAGNMASEVVVLDSGETVTRSWTYDHNWMASEQVVSSSAPSKIFRREYTFFYNAEGVPSNVKDLKRRRDDGSFQTVSYSYDGRNRPIDALFPDGTEFVTEYTGEWITKTYYKVAGVAIAQGTTQFGYDARGFQTSRRDARNNLTQFTYDNLGRITSMTDPLSEQMLYTYTDRVLTQTERGKTVADGEGQVTKYLYDPRNRLSGVQRKNDAGTFVNYLTYTRDSEDHILSVADAISRTTSMSYDLLGRLSRMTDPAGKLTQYAYDAADNRVSVIDPLNHETRFEYDDMNRNTAVVQLGVSPNPRTQFGFDAASNLTWVTDAEGHTTAYGYDALSRNTSVTQPLGQAVQYAFDSRDRVSSKVTARGQKIVYTYEKWGPVQIEQQYPTTSATTPSRTITYARDNDGHVTSVIDDGVQATALYTTTFDTLGRPFDETVKYLPGGDRVLQHRYDRYGNRNQITLQDGTAIASSYTYNKLNQMTTATLAGGAVGISYYANDDRQTLSLPNSVSRGYTYKTNGPVDTISVSGPGGQLASYAYSYDDARNVSTYADADGVHSYGYDGLNRVTTVTRPAPSGLPNESYLYDRVGNRKDPANISQWTYDGNNRITQGAALTYTFDADGSLATRSDAASFTHDTKSRLVQYTKGATTAVYVYDAAGRRIKTTVNGTATWFLWDGARLLSEYTGAGVRSQRYAYLPGDHVASQVQDANGTYYVHADNLQAPRILTNASGQIVWRAKYQAYGAATINADVDGNSVLITYNQRFPGQYADTESGLSYNYFRHYDPAIGRYHQSDPIGQDAGVNVYAYVGGNPVSWTDPTGLLNLVVGGGGAVVAGAAGAEYGSSVGYNFERGGVTGYTTTGSGAGLDGGQYGLYAGGGATAALIKGDANNVAGPFVNYTLAIPGTNYSVTVYTNPSGEVQGVGVGYGPGVGAARTTTNTVAYPVRPPNAPPCP